MVQIWFRFGSGLARLGATAVQIRFRIGSDLARPRLKASFGSELVQVWHGWPQWRFRFGSALVPSGSDSDLIRARFGQVWHGWAQWWFIFGSELVQVWLGLAPRQDSVQIRFRFGSAGLNGGSDLVWNWLRFRSDWTQHGSQARFWLRFGSAGLSDGADSVQMGFTFRSVWARLGSMAVQIRFRSGSDLVQIWADSVQIEFRFGSDLARLGTTAVQIRLSIGSDSVQIRFRVCLGLVRLGLKARLGFYLLQVLLGMVHIAFRFGPYLEQIWFVFGSAVVICDSDLV